MKKVLIHPRDKNACGMVRIYEPYQNLKVEGVEFVISDVIDTTFANDESIKAVLIQRADHEICPSYIRQMQKCGKIVVVETDDDISNIPPSNGYYSYYKSVANIYNECLKLADYVHTSTPELARSHKSVVFLNAANLKKYDQSKPEETKAILFQGSPSHADSLELVKPAISELLSMGHKVIMVSNLEWLKTIFKTPHPNLELRGWVETSEAHKIPLMGYINLTPLPKNKFNEAKSELKVLDAAVYGIPSVSSDIAPFRRFHEKSGGGNIIVKKERPRYWTEAILSLLENEELYKEKSRLSKQAVLEHYDLEIINKQRADWWKKILC